MRLHRLACALSRAFIQTAIVVLLGVCADNERQQASAEIPAIRPLPPISSVQGREAGELLPSPVGPVAWWAARIRAPLRPAAANVPVNVEILIDWALQRSPHIHVIALGPAIRETAILEAEADFDWRTFMESKWTDVSEPVGNVLTTGGPLRFRDHQWTYSAGARRQHVSGGEFEFAQQFGFQETNSNFFIPKNQGTAVLTLSYTQPLLQGRGQMYNTSRTILARLDLDIARDEELRQIQDLLLRVTQTYWQLYLKRAVRVQRQQLYDAAREVAREIEVRRDGDVDELQRAQAHSAVAQRRTLLLRADMEIHTAENQLQALVGADPAADDLEWIPVADPVWQAAAPDMADAVATAMQFRPEIGRILKELQSASVRLQVSKNELLPALDLILQTYVMGLQGDSQVGQAWIDQFSVGEPSYSAGLVFEVPLGNQAAQARHRRRELEKDRLVSQFRVVVDRIRLEVERAVREVVTTAHEVWTEQQSRQAVADEIHYLRQRQRLYAGDQSAGLHLRNLLDAQERLAAADFELVLAQTSHSVALVELKRVTGTLFRFQPVGCHLSP